MTCFSKRKQQTGRHGVKVEKYRIVLCIRKTVGGWDATRWKNRHFLFCFLRGRTEISVLRPFHCAARDLVSSPSLNRSSAAESGQKNFYQFTRLTESTIVPLTNFNAGNLCSRTTRPLKRAAIAPWATTKTAKNRKKNLKFN